VTYLFFIGLAIFVIDHPPKVQIHAQKLF